MSKEPTSVEPEVLTQEGGALAVREPTPGELIDRALDRGATPEAIEKLVELYERLKAGAAREAFVVALSKFQSLCPIIVKEKDVGKKGDKVHYQYAPLSVIVGQVRSILHECELSYTIDTEFKDGLMYAICTVTHVLGHSESSRFMAPIDPKAFMNESHKYASAQTYAKRYAFCNALGILTGDEDDDARSVGTPGEKDEPVPEAPKPPDVVQSGGFTHDNPDTYSGAMAEYKKLGARYLTEICDGDTARRKTDYDKFREQAGVPLDKKKLSLIELRGMNALVSKVFEEPPAEEKEAVPCEDGCGEHLNPESYQANYAKKEYGMVLCYNCAAKRARQEAADAQPRAD